MEAGASSGQEVLQLRAVLRSPPCQYELLHLPPRD